MNVSGTLHFYSGDADEFFFVFDDHIAQELNGRPEFDLDHADTRRVFISVGEDRFIHRRTLSFSRKQTEVKVSLCSKASKDGLGALTTLYEWFRDTGAPRPAPFALIGKLEQVQHGNDLVWELSLTEPIDLVTPPGLTRRKKAPPSERISFLRRRLIIQSDLAKIGRIAEELALELAEGDFPVPNFSCLWRDEYLDSERIEVRKIGIIADIDIWDEQLGEPRAFLEIKAQKVTAANSAPTFYLSPGEWRSYRRAQQANMPYVIWLFQYKDIEHFTNARHQIALFIFDILHEDWLEPDNFIVSPGAENGVRYDLI